MRVVHSPIEIAGQMGIISRGLQQIGIDSTAFNTFHTYLGYRDFIHNVDIFELEHVYRDMLNYFDIFHFHYGATLLPDFMDLEDIRRMGKPMIMHHWGNDVRTHAIASLNNRFVYTGDSPSPESIHHNLTLLSSYIDFAIVQDYEVYPYVAAYYKKVQVLPIAMDVLGIKPAPPSVEQTCPLVIHAPTNPLFKGTAIIEAAIAQLQAEGLCFTYRRIEQMSNAEALDFYRNADLVIDQILCGSYGMLAVESMSLAKPVIGYIREDLKPLYPEIPPIISANPEQFYSVLKELILSPALRVELGLRGRTYVEKHHDIRSISLQLEHIYNEFVH